MVKSDSGPHRSRETRADCVLLDILFFAPCQASQDLKKLHYVGVMDIFTLAFQGPPENWTKTNTMDISTQTISIKSSLVHVRHMSNFPAVRIVRGWVAKALGKPPEIWEIISCDSCQESRFPFDCKLLKDLRNPFFVFLADVSWGLDFAITHQRDRSLRCYSKVWYILYTHKGRYKGSVTAKNLYWPDKKFLIWLCFQMLFLSNKLLEMNFFV